MEFVFLTISWMEGHYMLRYIIIFLGFYYLLLKVYDFWQLPPGPFGLPVVGYLPFMKEDQISFLKELTEQFGDVFSFQFGQRLTVVLGSWDAIKEAFIKRSDVFAGRPNISFIGLLCRNNSLVVMDGEDFSVQKNFHLTSLRDYGFGKLSLEEKIQEEAQAMMEVFREQKSQPMNVIPLFNYMTTNVLCSLAFGARYDYKHPQIKQLSSYFEKLMILINQTTLVEAFPIMRYLPNKITGLDKIYQVTDELYSFVDEIVKEHIRTFETNKPRDLIDHYLQKMEDMNINNCDTQSRVLFSRHNMIQNLILTFFAGTETTATTLVWAIKLLVSHPDVQKEIQKEIDTVIGKSRLPSWADRNKLPYTEATIYEVHRIATILPVNVPHSNIEEVYISGYKIPKRSCILANLWEVHFDCKLWKNPEKFDPTRFLNSKGKAVKPEYLIPFSVGKRMCLGEPLARMEILIFFASFLQNFSFHCIGGAPDVSLGFDGLLRKPKPFEVIVEPRS